MGSVHWLRTSAPAAEPVTAAEAKLQCHIAGSDYDTELAIYIQAAREDCEEFTGRSLITQTWTMELDEWPNNPEMSGLDRYAIFVPRPPVASVTSVKYYDTNGTQQTLTVDDDYRVHIGDVTRITPAYGTSWPSVRPMTKAIEVITVHGYGAASTNVPAKLRQGMLMRIASYFRNREDEISGTITSRFENGSTRLWEPFRVPGVMVA